MSAWGVISSAPKAIFDSDFAAHRSGIAAGAIPARRAMRPLSRPDRQRPSRNEIRETPGIRVKRAETRPPVQLSAKTILQVQGLSRPTTCLARAVNWRSLSMPAAPTRRLMSNWGIDALMGRLIGLFWPLETLFESASELELFGMAKLCLKCRLFHLGDRDGHLSTVLPRRLAVRCNGRSALEVRASFAPRPVEAS